ncbi:TPA: hypothetical protein ACP7Q5_004907 [Escherichia coli]|jgi:hypothetical protein|uniref:hypothetical protein n=1 Tax=Enterococcus TaxID=1350 RepID=UPI0025B5E69E|nr:MULTISPECIES: hypothetical protein [Enterococcus]ELG7156061.1 DUF1737 domain-containing protein [Staphylococcus aureus]HEH8886053.1 DUF1737 domain-containing protein [Salmonella enterica]HEN8660958.1 DUF1737 domain-containing protein [Pseudomonas aeruginosa]ELL1200979.1 DUF1737 domain-containing protein [Staphylococcus aureus]MDN3040505.1 hypothetical protein [Enterococcus faecium]
MQYTVLNAVNRDNLIELVNEFIKVGGWEPLGGIGYSSNAGFIQAMVKIEVTNG